MEVAQYRNSCKVSNSGFPEHCFRKTSRGNGLYERGTLFRKPQSMQFKLCFFFFTLFRLEVYKRAGISRVEVYKGLGKLKFRY